MHTFSSLLAATLIAASTLAGHAETIAVAADPITLQAPGIASGLDVQVVVSALVQAEITPTVERKAPSDAYLKQLAPADDMPSSTASPPTRIKAVPLEDVETILSGLGF